MATTDLTAIFSGAPFVDTATGQITAPWRAFLLALYNRTGKTKGTAAIDTATLNAEITAEQNARIAGDNALGASLATETTQRKAGDAANASAITAETQTRQLNDSLLVPKAQLAALWTLTNLGAVLPTTDPGGGLPWLNGNTLSVGSVAAVTPQLLLEDASGPWLLEAGTLVWQWG